MREKRSGTKGSEAGRSREKQSESGYALVGLMAVILFALILTTAAAPSIKQETQREREEEMLWRGQQIQNAMAGFAGSASRNGNKKYPTQLKELVDGISDGTKKTRFLRPSAICDPMSPCDPEGESNWRLVHPGDPLPNELLNALLQLQQQQQQQQTGFTIQIPQDLRTFAQMGATQLPGGESSGDQDDQKENTANPAAAAQPPASSAGMGSSSGFSSSGFSSSGMGASSSLGFDAGDKQPIIGVVSSKSDQMFRSYYGIELYDHALFFPGVPVVAGGFNREAFAVPVTAQSVSGATPATGVPGGVPAGGAPTGGAGGSPFGQQGSPFGQSTGPR